ncbi:MAG: hypothetical protein WD801_16435 [Gemmatimonadaceae bacterium]
MQLLRRAFAPAAAIMLAACADKPAPIDAELARDIELASAVQQSHLLPQDTALSAEPEKRPAANPSPAAPRRETPIVRPPTPAPRVQPPPTVEPERAPEPTPAPAPSMRGILAGTSFALATKGQICTNTGRPGDKIVATLTSAVTGEGGAYIPEGASVVLEVASVTPGDTPADASITLRVRSIVINGESRNMDGSVALVSDLARTQVARDGGSDRKKVIGGAIAGAIIGQIAGRDTKSTVIGAAAGAAAGAGAAALSRKYDACLPAGSTVRVTTTQPLALTA